MGIPSLPHSIMLLWIVASSNFGLGFGQYGTLNVPDFGAIGNGLADDTQAFDTAWNTLCSTGQTLNIPAGQTFLVKPLQLLGPCKSDNLVIQLDGNIVGPSTLADWQDACALQCWLCFKNVNGLVIQGKGSIDGKGSLWWKQTTQYSLPKDANACDAPVVKIYHLLSLNYLYIKKKCFTLRKVRSTSIIWNYINDSPKGHICVFRCNGAHISDIHVNAPENSPNTDGIDVSDSSQVTIQDSVIGTGDDCVAIKGGSYFVNVSRVTCGPGHGFSVGSLGVVPSVPDEVHDIHFQNCNCNNTENCARIKTYMGGSGFAKEISYDQMTLQQSKNPILIDQHYCDGGDRCTAMAGAVSVSDITFRGFTGSSASVQAITLNCSDSGCANIVLDHVTLSTGIGKPLTSSCYKATGKATVSTPPVPCLSGSSKKYLSQKKSYNTANHRLNLINGNTRINHNNH